MIAKLKELRTKKGLSQQALAEVIGISQQSINKYENHDIEPDYAVLTQFAAYFGVSTDYLIGHSAVRSVDASALTAQEAALLAAYRRLDADERASIDGVIANYLKYK